MSTDERIDISPEWSDDQGVKYRIAGTTLRTEIVEVLHPDVPGWAALSPESQEKVLKARKEELPSGAQLFAIDITGIIVEPDPMGRGYQAHVEGDKGRWSRGDSVDEAVGSLIRRLAVEHEGANWRRKKDHD